MILWGVASELVAKQSPGNQSGWFPFYLAYDPTDGWAQITAPVLALLGELDVQVDAEQNATGFEAIFEASGHDDYTIVVFPPANHLFQDAVTGGVKEYALEPLIDLIESGCGLTDDGL